MIGLFKMITFLLQSAYSETCRKYSCIDEVSDKLECGVNFNGDYFFKPCEDTLYSHCVQSEESAFKCEVPMELEEHKYVGEKCYVDIDCNEHALHGCIDKVCKGLGQGDELITCESSFFCDPGYYCKQEVCVPQLLENEYGCITDYDCQNQLTCDSGFCKPYQSVPDGSSVLSCKYGLNFACESLLCYTDYFGSSYCMPEIYRTAKSPIECSQDSDCRSVPDNTTGVVVESKCSCGLNAEGKKFCELVTGDDEYSTYIDKLGKWLRSESVLKCNSLRRDSLGCIKDWWEHDDAVSLMYYKETVRLYTKLQQTEYCTEVVMLEEYIKLKHQFQHIKSVA